MAEEIFGPILPVSCAPRDVDDAVGRVLEGDKPLALYVFSRDEETAGMVLAATSSGSAAVNHAVLQLAHPDLPFGGVGASGYGAYHGQASLETFSHRKSVLHKPFSPDPPVLYPPMKP